MKTSNRIFGPFSLMLTLVVMAGCASSPDTAEGNGTSAAIEEDPDRMVCRREKDTGSRLASRTCKTAAEWEQERLDNQDAMRNAQKSPAGLSNLPSVGGG